MKKTLLFQLKYIKQLYDTNNTKQYMIPTTHQPTRVGKSYHTQYQQLDLNQDIVNQN